MTGFDDGLFDEGYFDDVIAAAEGACYTFIPPTSASVPRLLARSQGTQRALFRYHQPHVAGRNVWKLTDGTFTYTQPYPTLTREMADPDSPTSRNTSEATYEKVYLGGHLYVVCDEEAQDLIDAGFTLEEIGSTVLIDNNGRRIVTSEGQGIAVTT